MLLEFRGLNTNKFHQELIDNGVAPQLVEDDNGKTYVHIYGEKADTVNKIALSHNPEELPKQPAESERLEALEMLMVDILGGGF